MDVPKAKRVNATCESGPLEIDATFGSLKNAKIANDGSFDFDNSGVDDEGNPYVAWVRGTIDGKSASGVLRYQGPTNFRRRHAELRHGRAQMDGEESLTYPVSFSRSSIRRILPVRVFGSSSVNSIFRG